MFLEDAGYDWKLLGPDVSDVDYVAWQADQDAYACSGQKCSAQSLLIMHTNWRKVAARAGSPHAHMQTRAKCHGSRLVAPHPPPPTNVCSIARALRRARLRGVPQAGLLDKMKARAASRKLDDLTIGPVLTWTTEAMLEHMHKLLAIPGAAVRSRAVLRRAMLHENDSAAARIWGSLRGHCMHRIASSAFTFAAALPACVLPNGPAPQARSCFGAASR